MNELKTLGAVHTHTHTHTPVFYKKIEKEKIIEREDYAQMSFDIKSG